MTVAHGVDRSGAASGSGTLPGVDTIMWNDVIFLTSADSPYNVTDANNGVLLVCDCTSGAITINLPTIASELTNFPAETWLLGVKKSDSTGNAVTINRDGTDTIDTATSKSLATINAGVTLVPDTDPSPDRWVTMEWGPTGGNFTVDTFSGDGSDTTFDLSVDPGTENNTFVYISGVYQQKSEYAISGTTLTFSAAPPAGTNNVQVVIGTTLAIGTPGDGTVTTAKLNDEAVTTAKIDDGAVTSAKLAASALPRGHLAGLNMSTAGSSATMSIAAGQAVDSTNAVMVALSSTLAKTTSAWAVGNNGGLDSGSIANSTWYAFYLIYRSDTGVVDVVFSTNGTTPTLPTNYTHYRRIGWGLTNGSAQWVAFTQTGDSFRWLVPVNDVNAQGAASANRTARTLTAAPSTEAVFSFNMNTGAVGILTRYVLFTSSDMTDSAASSTQFSVVITGENAGSTGTLGVPEVRLMMNSSRQVFERADNSAVVVSYMTRGWNDRRGRDD